MTTLAERIQQVIDAGFTQVELANAAGVTKGATNQWLNGGIKSLKLEYAQGIERLTGFRSAWLVIGEEPKRKSDERGTVEPQRPTLVPDSPPPRPTPEELAELFLLYEGASVRDREWIMRIARTRLKRKDRATGSGG